LTGVAPGRHVLRAELHGAASAVTAITINPDQVAVPVRLELGMKRDPALTLTVLDVDGAPVGGAFAFVEEEGQGLRLVSAAADGRLVVSLQPPFEGRVRVAALGNGVWGFTAWLDRDSLGEPLVLRLSRPGTLTIEAKGAEGIPTVVAPGGWDLARLLLLLGSPPTVGGGVTAIEGLPEGPYVVQLAGRQTTVTVRRGERVTAVLTP
jgi:hypothetical protein